MQKIYLPTLLLSFLITFGCNTSEFEKPLGEYCEKHSNCGDFQICIDNYCRPDQCSGQDGSNDNCVQPYDPCSFNGECYNGGIEFCLRPPEHLTDNDRVFGTCTDQCFMDDPKFCPDHPSGDEGIKGCRFSEAKEHTFCAFICATDDDCPGDMMCFDTICNSWY